MTDSSLVDDPVRWGILSTAGINEELIGPLQQSPTSTLLGVASRTSDAAAAYAAKWGIERSYGSYDELLGDKDIEVVYVPLPNGLHRLWTQAALEAGKHVFCEKPFTPTAQAAEELFAIAEARGLKLAEAVMYRHHPQTTRLQQLVKDEVGDLRSLHAGFHYPIPALPDNVRSDAALAGGALRDGGSYCVSLCNLLAGGEPQEVVGRAVRVATSGVDVAFAAMMTYANGATASFDVSMDSPLTLWMVATGSERSLRVPNPYQPGRPGIWAPGPCPDEALLYVRGEEVAVSFSTDNPFLLEVEDFSRVVRGMEAFVVPPEETIRNMRTLERLLESAGLPPFPENA